MKTTYIRWSMTITEMDDVTVLTDPVFQILGYHLPPRRYGIELLPAPDLILISHRHIDHWDLWTMRRLPRETPLLVRPNRIAEDARRLGYTRVQELHPWEETQVKGLTVTAVPAVHPGSEVGFVFQGEKTVYFAGDTSFDRQIFTAIGQRFELDLALLPIGGLRFFGQSFQIDPPQAVEAIELLRPRVVVGTHWGCLPRIPPIVDMPGTPQALARLLAEEQVDVEVGGMAPLETVEI